MLMQACSVWRIPVRTLMDVSSLLLVLLHLILVRCHCTHTQNIQTYDTIQYNTIRYDTIRYNTIRYATIRYDTIRAHTYVHMRYISILTTTFCIFHYFSHHTTHTHTHTQTRYQMVSIPFLDKFSTMQVC